MIFYLSGPLIFVWLRPPCLWSPREINRSSQDKRVRRSVFEGYITFSAYVNKNGHKKNPKLAKKNCDRVFWDKWSKSECSTVKNRVCKIVHNNIWFRISAWRFFFFKRQHIVLRLSNLKSRVQQWLVSIKSMQLCAPIRVSFLLIALNDHFSP